MSNCPPSPPLRLDAARTPVAFGAFLLTAASSIAASFLVASSTSKRGALGLGLSSLSQAWRLGTSQFAFATNGELVVGLILLYNFRQFERQFGSKKFAVRAPPYSSNRKSS